MARPPSVWHREQDGHFYTTIRGQKVKLSPDKKEATRLFHELLAKNEEPAGSQVSPPLKRIAELFLEESQRTKKPNTYRMARMFLQSFCDHVGRKRVADLKVHHVTSWVGAHQWNESTGCSARSTVLACLNWAVTQGHVDSHPLAKLKRGSHKRRERYLTSLRGQQMKDLLLQWARAGVEQMEREPRQ